MIQVKNKRVTFALLLAFVFISTFLIKPLHVFDIQHHSHNQAEGSKDYAHHSDCSVCYYAFSPYIPEGIFNLHFYTNLSHICIEEKECQPIHKKYIFHRSLRAPPAISSSRNFYCLAK